jgi:hypothetical protein
MGIGTPAEPYPRASPSIARIAEHGFLVDVAVAGMLVVARATKRPALPKFPAELYSSHLVWANDLVYALARVFPLGGLHCTDS